MTALFDRFGYKEISKSHDTRSPPLYANIHKKCKEIEIKIRKHKLSILFHVFQGAVILRVNEERIANNGRSSITNSISSK